MFRLPHVCWAAAIACRLWCKTPCCFWQLITHKKKVYWTILNLSPHTLCSCYNCPTIGLLRRSGSHSTIAQIAKNYNSGTAIALAKTDCHTVAGVFKLFFRWTRLSAFWGVFCVEQRVAVVLVLLWADWKWWTMHYNWFIANAVFNAKTCRELNDRILPENVDDQICDFLVKVNIHFFENFNFFF